MKDTLEEFPKSLQENEMVATPAADDMFAQGHGKKSSPERGEVFHRIIAKGLFACKRARPDMQPVVSVLCTRVKKPGRNDWNKSVKKMKWLNCTQHDKSTLSAEKGLHSIERHVDASFAVHPDCRSHAGASQAFEGGKGAIQNVSAKQKSNTSGSATSEPVAVDQVLPLTLWTPLFLEAQGHKIKNNRVCQDNKSTMLLEKNGKMSSG